MESLDIDFVIPDPKQRLQLREFLNDMTTVDEKGRYGRSGTWYSWRETGKKKLCIFHGSGPNGRRHLMKEIAEIIPTVYIEPSGGIPHVARVLGSRLVVIAADCEMSSKNAYKRVREIMNYGWPVFGGLSGIPDVQATCNIIYITDHLPDKRDAGMCHRAHVIEFPVNVPDASRTLAPEAHTRPGYDRPIAHL